MTIIRRRASPLAFAGSIWAILFALFLVYSMPIRVVVSSTAISYDEDRQAKEPVVTVEEPVTKKDTFPVLGFGAAAGAIGVGELACLLSVKRRPKTVAVITRVSAIGMLLLSIALFRFGYLLLPSALLLLLVVIGMGRSEAKPGWG